MIEINKLKSDKTIKEKIKSFKKSKTSDVQIKQSPFYDKLLEVSEVEDINLELDKLIEQIDKVGKKFANDTNLENLKEYKSLIKAFLETVINKMFKVKEKYGHRSWVKQKVFIIVEKINERLERLTNFILEKENQNINLLATLDEIRGLLVDLYK
ncbi:MAG: YaaR family protein [Spirochaetes bacterium]|nr:YaaR family protein [Spirochaetota bacterium]